MILLENLSIVPMTQRDLVEENANILIEDGKIKKISKEKISSLEEDGLKTIDCRGKLALPGLINTHTHMGMCLFRNYGNDLALKDWLEKAIYPLEAKLRPEDVYYGALLNMAELIKSGSTRLVDMYMKEGQIARAALDMGMGAVLATGFVDWDDYEKSEEEIRYYTEKFKDSSLIDFAIAPHAIYTVGTENFEKLRDLSEELDTIIHTHLSETKEEVETAYKEYGKSPVSYLNDLGIFDRPTIAAHCVHLSDEDLDILADKKVNVSHNPSSNLKLASGFAPVHQMIKKGINVSLGTDGSASNNNINMVEEMHIASLLAKGVSADPKAMDAYQSLQVATVNGAKAIRRPDLGQIKEGFTADLAIYDMDKVHLSPLNDTVAGLVYALQGSDAHTVIIEGEIVMEDRKLCKFDEDALKKEVRERAEWLING